MAAQKNIIEFLPQEDWEKKPAGKILKWALSIGRYIVITTELIVIIAFLSRFKFDRDLTDLNEEIKQKQTIIESQAQFEQEFRFLQKKLAAIESLEKQRLQTNKILDELSSLTPIDVYLSNLQINNQEINLSAIALSETGLATLINNIKNSSLFNNLNLSQVSSGAEKTIGINFEVKSKLAKNE